MKLIENLASRRSLDPRISSQTLRIQLKPTVISSLTAFLTTLFKSPQKQQNPMLIDPSLSTTLQRLFHQHPNHSEIEANVVDMTGRLQVEGIQKEIVKNLFLHQYNIRIEKGILVFKAKQTTGKQQDGIRNELIQKLSGQTKMQSIRDRITLEPKQKPNNWLATLKSRIKPSKRLIYDDIQIQLSHQNKKSIITSRWLNQGSMTLVDLGWLNSGGLPIRVHNFW